MACKFTRITNFLSGQLTQALITGNEICASSLEATFMAIYVHALSKTPYGILRGSTPFVVPSKNPI